MAVHIVNPLAIQIGDKIETKGSRPRTVKHISACSSSPESIHLDGECYDVRFATVKRVS